ncbi:C-C motif chemokine 20-like [Rana temporaria]|uniref:C-C motif chemokine 20-like n=1 Tax=Rana temporaria TaxID=8407 RepID=UPI001AACDF31|nr:C-C motif chemokine 20-like [Rana temporaria]
MATSRNLYVLSFAFLVMVLDVSQAFGSHDCCIKYNKKKPSLKMIEDYYQQKSTQVCDIDATIFLVRTSPCISATVRVCADPRQKWVQNLIKALDQRTQKKKQRRLKKLKKSCIRLKKQLY